MDSIPVGIASYKEHLDIDTPSLPDVIENPHVTFGFCVEPVDGFDELFASYTDSDWLVLIVNYSALKCRASGRCRSRFALQRGMSPTARRKQSQPPEH